MEQLIQPQLAEAIRDYSPKGLTPVQVNAKKARYGENKFKKSKTNGWSIFFRQFINPLSFILLFASFFSIAMGEVSDAVIILSIVFLNSCLSFIQEFRSGKAIEKLSQLIEKRCLVIRNNQRQIVDASQLVPGDALILKNGDVVPADSVIMESYDLSVNESQLTGESTPLYKNEKDDSNNILYTGSVIEKGHCSCAVFATGAQSELGKLSDLSRNTKKITPYQKSLSTFSKWLLRLVGATVVLLLCIKAATIGNTRDFADVVLFAIALAMTTVPEALPMITTINLSYGALKLAKQNVIVKRLSATENLGRMNLLCTDKTGTLTEDKLTIANIVSDNQKLFQQFSYITMESYAIKGETYRSSYDEAIIQYVPSEIQVQMQDWKLLQTTPFDPALRRRHVIAKSPKGKTYLFVIGAPETLLAFSSTASTHFSSLIKQWGEKGMRQLAIAYKEIEFNEYFCIPQEETALTFLGFANLYDPLRKTAKETLHKAQKLGLDIKILTGDSVEVAAYTGRSLGLLSEHDSVYTGEELTQLSPAEFDRVVRENSIFARVSPVQKYNIIQSLQKDYVVGYQGDGINDAPALKLADVSIAMHNATDVARDSADILLTEDNLEAIISGVESGRSIFININKYIKHAMIGNLGNFFSMIVFYLLFAADIPMLAIQLLIGNIIQDMPLMTVFSDSVDTEELKKPQADNPIRSIVMTSCSLGIFTAIYYLLFFLFIGTAATPLTQTMLFLFYNFTQLLVIISIRNEGCYFWQGTKPSRLLIASIAVFIIISIALTYIPFTASLMGFTPLSFHHFILLVGSSLAYIFLIDIAKVLRSKRQKLANAKHTVI